jgi:hypothetical protein
MITMSNEEIVVTAGVDTHSDTHGEAGRTGGFPQVVAKNLEALRSNGRMGSGLRLSGDP